MERFDVDQNKQRKWSGTDTLTKRTTTLVQRSTKKTQFEVKRSTPKAFLLLVVGSADREGQQM